MADPRPGASSAEFTPAELLAIINGTGPGLTLPRHRHHLTAEEVETSQRWRLLAATAEVIARQGYSQTSVDQIAKQAGVSKKSFYKFFADKEAAFLAAYDSIGVVIADLHSEAATATATTLDELLHAVLGQYVHLLQSAPSFSTMLLLRAHGATAAIMDRRLLGIAAYTRAMKHIVDQGRAAGIPIADLSDAEMTALLGGINELCVQHVHRHGAQTLDQITDTLCRFAQRVLTP